MFCIETVSVQTRRLVTTTTTRLKPKKPSLKALASHIVAGKISSEYKARKKLKATAKS